MTHIPKSSLSVYVSAGPRVCSMMTGSRIGSRAIPARLCSPHPPDLTLFLTLHPDAASLAPFSRTLRGVGCDGGSGFGLWQLRGDAYRAAALGVQPAHELYSSASVRMTIGIDRTGAGTDGCAGGRPVASAGERRDGITKSKGNSCRQRQQLQKPGSRRRCHYRCPIRNCSESPPPRVPTPDYLPATEMLASRSCSRLAVQLSSGGSGYSSEYACCLPFTPPPAVKPMAARYQIGEDYADRTEMGLPEGPADSDFRTGHDYAVLPIGVTTLGGKTEDKAKPTDPVPRLAPSAAPRLAVHTWDFRAIERAGAHTVDDRLADQPWFHGGLPRLDAEARLIQCRAMGSCEQFSNLFLVREKVPGQTYAVTILSPMFDPATVQDSNPKRA